MKTIITSTIGVTPLSEQEIKATNGGGVLLWLLGVLAGGVVWDIANNPKEAAEVFKDGANYDYYRK